MRWILLPGLLLIGCGEPQCDAEGLASALEGAGIGDVVEVGACRIEGDFTLPGGVTLRGTGGSVIAGRIDMSSGRVEQLKVESTDAGIVARNGGGVFIHDVEVAATTGIGIAVDNVSSADLQRITLRGPIDASNLVRGTAPDPMTTATHGLIAFNVPNVAITDLSARGFARFGALLKDSSTTWTRGDANDNAWVGIMVAHGDATISDVEANDTLDLQLVDAAAFGVVTGTAAVETNNLVVRGSEGFGLFHFNGSVVHAGLTASDNSHGGVRMEIVTAADISGELADNDFGAITAYSSGNVVVHDSMIRSSAKVVRMEGSNMVESGDGIQLVNSIDGSRIENTTIAGNDRAGVVLELFGRALTAGLFDNVAVTRDGPTENGVLVQGGTRSADWDTGLMRDADTIIADDAVTDAVDIVGAVGPCFTPRN